MYETNIVPGPLGVFNFFALWESGVSSSSSSSFSINQREEEEESEEDKCDNKSWRNNSPKPPWAMLGYETGQKGMKHV